PLCILGHTDSIGGEAYNQDLGARRAIAVARELESALETRQPGLAATLGLTVESRGEEAPGAPNTSPANRAHNRKVEIFLYRRWLSFGMDEFLALSSLLTGLPFLKKVDPLSVENRMARDYLRLMK